MDWTLPIFCILCVSAGFAVPVRTNFEKCDYKGFSCQSSKTVPGKTDVVFQCNTTVTSQDILIYLWIFNAPTTIASFTIKDCEKLQLSFACSADNKPIQSLKIQNVGLLEIVPAFYTHNPPEIHVENVRLENIPRNTFSQIKSETYRPGCIVPINDLSRIVFSNVTVGNVETESFKNLTGMKEFTWNKVEVGQVSTGGIKLNFEEDSGADLRWCKFGVLEPMAFQVIGDSFSMSNTKLGDVWGSGLNGTIYDFNFSNNSVGNLQSGAISVLAQNVYILDNHFESIESGAFQKISPGLLFDSKKNFGKLKFVYKFNNNLIENLEDGGIRPDVGAYKNVAHEVYYVSNKLQCPDEGLGWYGADVDLGLGYSVIKDFSATILGEQVTQKAPCMCFGVKPPSKRNTVSPANF